MPGADVGEVGHPESVRCGRTEVPVDQVGRTLTDIRRDRRPPGLASDRSHQFEFSHQASHTVAADLDALAAELAPDLLGAVDIEVLPVHPSDLDLELLVAQLARRRWSRDRRVISRRGDLQRLADRLDPEAVPVFVDELHYFGSRGSSSRAKKAEAAFRDLVGPPQLTVLLLQLSDALLVLGRNSRSFALVDLCLLHPVSQRLRAQSELHSDACHHAVTFACLLHGLLDHPDRPLSELRRVSMSRSLLRRLVLRCCHGLHPPKECSLHRTQCDS